MLMLLLPHVPSTFALLVLGENAVQACAIACSLGITFETIGPQNPLAATNYAVLNAAYNVPITYMLLVDGAGYERWGVAGALAVDRWSGSSPALRSVCSSAYSPSGRSPSPPGRLSPCRQDGEPSVPCRNVRDARG